MFNSLKNLILFAVLSAVASVAAVVEPIQIQTERYNDHGVHYGLPGWERGMGHPDIQDWLPDSGSKSLLHINMCDPRYMNYKMQFGGKEYCDISITSTGRIYLGNLPDGSEFKDDANGSYPYIEPTKMELIPPEDPGFIYVRAMRFLPSRGYGVVEIGPFNIEGFDKPLSYQVFLYLDGEIQFQAWGYWGEIAGYTYCGQYRQSFLNEFRGGGKEYLNPSLYTGGKLLSSDYKAMTSLNIEPILTNGKLRPGWIAKSFDKKHVVFTQETDAILVDFGQDTAAGGLFAYDYSREHPVVGSFSYVTMAVESVNYGDGRDANNAVPVWFWYFGKDSSDLIEEADKANYPVFRDGLKMQQFKAIEDSRHNVIPDEKKFSSLRENIIIWPITYMTSWNFLNGINLIDETKAIAFKFQTSEKARNRAVRIKNVSYGLRQPRSVQFLPPETHSLSFEADGGLGYMRGVNFSESVPYAFVDGATVVAEIVSLPGYLIEEIDINDIPVYKSDGSIFYENIVVDKGDEKKEIILPDWWNVDAHVKVKYKKCGNRLLPEVNPSYVRSEIFIDPSDTSRKLESYAVNDGLGRVVQVQAPLRNGYYEVSATYLDDYGNVEYAPMPYLSQKDSFAYEDMSCKQCVIKSSNYYNGTDDLDRQNAFGFPYVEQNYHYGEDYGVTRDAAGVAEASFANWNVSAKQWTIPLETPDVSNFLQKEQLEEGALTVKYEAAKAAIVGDDANVENWTEYSYKLVVNRSAEGVFTQQIFDANGNILYAWAMSGDNSTIVSRTHYNKDNQVDTVDISVNGRKFGLPTIYTYDVAGRIKTISSPDRGTIETVYGPDGNLRFSRDARQLALAQKLNLNGNYFSTIEYDSFGRETKTGEVRGGHSFADSANPVPDNKLYILSENLYGKPTKGDILSTGVTTDDALLQNILDEMEGVLPNDVGAVASYDGSRTRDDVALKANTLKMSSYNRLGQKVRHWTIYGISGAPAIRTTYAYSVSGDLSSSETAEWKNGAWNTISTFAFSYDTLGRMNSILEDGDSLLRIDRTLGGTISKKAYFDKGSLVFNMTYAKDIYGRTSRVDYKDASGNTLYSEAATYPSVVAQRLATAVHAWDGYGSTESYAYDAQGRLTSYTSNNSRIGNGHYMYDDLGRITFKGEGHDIVSFQYNNSSFKPVSMNIDAGDTAFLSYDASGNVWLDRRTKSAYTLNSLGLPDRIRGFSSDPVSVTLDQVNSSAFLTDEITDMYFLYDESGNRIWKRETRPKDDHEILTVPGLGEYYAQHYQRSGDFSLRRIDLVGGGFRDVATGTALFPVKDMQGSVRGYADTSGLRSAFGYRPYGTSVELAFTSGDDGMRRWQSKEFEWLYGKYDFGARLYDPFFGLWMSPDPVGQFANPYTYGGDPLNYIDPTGMATSWSGGVGLVVSWDKEHGWGIGVGESVSIGKYGFNRSMMWNQDGSNTISGGFEAKIPIQTPYIYIEINMGLSFSLNSYSGAVFSTHGGACVGEVGTCVGEDRGGSVYFDRNGSFRGITVYYEAYVQYAGDLRMSAGYEAGLLGAEGRGLYNGISGFGLHAEISHLEDGLNPDNFSYGMQQQMYYQVENTVENKKTGEPKQQYAGWKFSFLGPWSNMFMYDHLHRNDNDIQRDVMKKGRSKFNEIADKNDMVVGEYPALFNLLHEKNTTKVYMGRKSIFSFLYGWFLFPSVEGLFWPGKDYAPAPSYNYGHNYITHFLLDILPQLIMPNKKPKEQK